MVERERLYLRERDPRGLAGVVPSVRCRGAARHPEHDRGRGMPWIPIRARIDPDQADRPGEEAGLLPQLPGHRGFDRLPVLDEAAGEGPATSKRGTSAADEQHPAPREPYGVDGEGRVPVVGGHAVPRP